MGRGHAPVLVLLALLYDSDVLLQRTPKLNFLPRLQTLKTPPTRMQ